MISKNHGKKDGDNTLINTTIMTKLDTTYLGLKLRNPLIAGSSGLTGSVDKIREMEEAGIGAVVLKSVFEEQINGEIGDLLQQSGRSMDYPEAEYYIRNYVRDHSLGKHTELVAKVKRQTKLPVIASINCVSASEWATFAGDLEQAGADAIELNVFHLPTNRLRTSEDVEKIYTDVAGVVKKNSKIPVSVKIGSHFTNITGLVERLKAAGARGVVLFNRFYEPDIDLEKLELKASEVFSTPGEARHVLRWIGLVSSSVPQMDLAASTGIHNGDTVVKMVLAGAQTVQLCSVLYLQGPSYVTTILQDIQKFMNRWNFSSIDEFRGRLSYKNLADPMVYERSQFMKYYSERKL